MALGEPFAFGDERWSEEDECFEYTTSDMQLRIAAQGLLLQQKSNEWSSPRKKAEVERHLSHIIFEISYRTHTIKDYGNTAQQAV